MDKQEIEELAYDQTGRIVCALLTHAAVKSNLSPAAVMKIYFAFREAMANEDDSP